MNLMYKNVYGNERVIIVCGKYEGMEKKCADYLYGELASELPYILTICEADNLTEEQKRYYTIITTGTKESNSFISELCDKGMLTIPEHKDGYRVKIFDNPWNKERQVIALAGGGGNGAIYAISHFVNKYLPENWYKDYDHILPEFATANVQGAMFSYKLKEVDWEETPQIAERGIWTWGHVIYDYKAFLDNMSRLRMNIITVWNDFVPINAKEFIAYAHELGIQVIWGFSIGWGYDYDISKDEVLDEIIAGAVENYRQHYVDLGGDGIYFQTFTERKEDYKDGVNIAERVAIFVNKFNRKFREQFGDIRIRFGLHATSVKNHLKEIGTIDPEVEIAWEDCGSFPYAYSPDDISEFEATKSFTEQITTLRGENEKFSAVLKGQSTLRWPTFEHQMGTFDMGVYSKRYVETKYQQKKKFWRQRNVLWIKNGEMAREMHEIIRQKTNGATTIEYLIEAGGFEEKISLSSAIAAQLMWNSSRNINDVIYEAGLMADVDF